MFENAGGIKKYTKLIGISAQVLSNIVPLRYDSEKKLKRKPI